MNSLVVSHRSGWAAPAGAGLISAVLFAASLWVPPIGYVLCLASPLPVALAARRWGTRGALPATLAGAVGAVAAAGLGGAATYVGQFAAGGCVLGLATRARRAPEWVVGGCALFATTASLATLGILTAQGGSGALTLMVDTLRQSVDSSLLQGDIDPEAALAVRAWVDQTGRFVLAAFPGILAVIATLTAWANAVALRRLMPDPEATSWTTWRTPEACIWVLIASGLAALVGKGALATLGLNVFLVTLGVYFLHGLAIVQHLFETRGFLPVFRAIAYVLIFCQLPVTVLVVGFGAFDLWFDFRSRWSPRPPPSDSQSGTDGSPDGDLERQEPEHEIE